MKCGVSFCWLCKKLHMECAAKDAWMCPPCAATAIGSGQCGCVYVDVAHHVTHTTVEVRYNNRCAATCKTGEQPSRKRFLVQSRKVRGFGSGWLTRYFKVHEGVLKVSPDI